MDEDSDVSTDSDNGFNCSDCSVVGHDDNAAEHENNSVSTAPLLDTDTTEYNVEPGGSGLVLVNQYMDYRWRPTDCEAMSVVEFFCFMEKKPKVCLQMTVYAAYDTLC